MQLTAAFKRKKKCGHLSVLVQVFNPGFDIPFSFSATFNVSLPRERKALFAQFFRTFSWLLEKQKSRIIGSFVQMKQWRTR